MTNREQIEANDLRLVKQFRKIALRKIEKKTEGRVFPMMKVLVAVMIGILSATVILYLRSENVEPSIQAAVATSPVKKNGEGEGLVVPPLSLHPSITGNKTETDKHLTVVSSALVPSSHIEEKSPSAASGETTKNKLIVDKEWPLLPAVTEHPGVSIGEIVTCRNVKNRQYVNSDHEFFLKNSPTPTVWMLVEAADPPFTLTHVYYVNGEKYCSVPLVIRYNRTRTWSRIKAATDAHLGKWRVDVVTDAGTVVGRVTFEVLP